MSKLIHIFEDTPHHYQPMQHFFAEQCTINVQQEFWVRTTNTKNKLVAQQSVVFKSYKTNSDLFNQLNQLPKSAQLVFHGLSNVHIFKRLVMMPIVKRSSCVIWGYELYRYNKIKRTIKDYIVQLLHIVLFKRLAKVITLTPGDSDLVAKLLKRKQADVLAYPLIGVAVPQQKVEKDVNKQTVKILVGNSAAKSNEHLIAFAQLAHLANKNIEVIVPLNYANNDGDYIAGIIKLGGELFLNKFRPITKMLAKDAYDDLLAEVDMAVFSHQRQQGLYVAYSMLLMGKPLFLRSDTSSYQNFHSLGFDVKAFNTLEEHDFLQLQRLVTEPSKKNQALMTEHFTEQALAPKWSSMLNGLLFKSLL